MVSAFFPVDFVVASQAERPAVRDIIGQVGPILEILDVVCRDCWNRISVPVKSAILPAFFTKVACPLENLFPPGPVPGCLIMILFHNRQMKRARRAAVPFAVVL